MELDFKLTFTKIMQLLHRNWAKSLILFNLKRVYLFKKIKININLQGRTQGVVEGGMTPTDGSRRYNPPSSPSRLHLSLIKHFKKRFKVE